ncbi:MAG: hypothetical protein J3Q66DRAFT_372497 [Benniella sp.]|nr:MAG: hypothetical protein J3Q66DRAFT_372497 [Benniella sp.]
MRGHSLGTKFSEEDAIPERRNAIDYFEQNQKLGMFADFSKSKFRPTYVLLSEEYLVDIFSTDTSVGGNTRDIMFDALNHTTDRAAADHVLDNKGALIAKLLYPVGEQNSRHNAYHKKLALQANEGDFSTS